MSNLPISLLDEFDLPDWEALNPAQIELSPEQVQQATQLSQSVRLSEQRWQIYLAALGMLGFQQWLSDRAPDLLVQTDQASIRQPAYANLIPAVCNLQVGAFKVCLIPVSDSVDDTVSVPVAAFDLPDFAAHFYVLMQAIEEVETVAVSGFLSYEQYRQSCSTLQAEADWTYRIPRDWFNSDANLLLLQLRCLESSAIRLPALETMRSTIALRERLATLNVQTQAPWNVLTVEEGLTLLSDPTLVHSLYVDSTQPSINVGLWFRNQMDAIAQELGWILMPLPRLSAVRSLREDFDSIRSTLEQQGVQIPADAHGAYRTLRSQQGSFRLYAVTWVLAEASEWMLLVTLGAEPNESMPSHLKLSVRDQTQLLFEQSLDDRDLSSRTSRNVLYAQVIGNRHEKFWLTITANETDVFEIPPLGLEIDPAL